MNSLDTMTTILKLLADQTRLRILAVLDGTELTVKELTGVLQVGQSTLSTQLGQLKDANLVLARKQGQYVFYRLSSLTDDHPFSRLSQQVISELPRASWYERDQRRLGDLLEQRREASLSFFNTGAARNQPSPGQTWQATALGLSRLITELRIIDLGCGIGRMSALLANSGNKVVGIDNSAEQIEVAKHLNASVLANGNLLFVCAAMEKTGTEPDSFDAAIISQALHHAARPTEVLAEVYRILKPGGKLLILDVVRHNEEWVHDKFADFWLGFDPAELGLWLKTAGFSAVHYEIGLPDANYPEIEPLILLATK